MQHLVLVLACLACAGHGRRTFTSRDRLQSGPSVARHQPIALQDSVNRSSTLATFLLALRPAAAAFAPVSPRLPVSARSRSSVVKALPDVLSSRRGSPLWMVAPQQVFKLYYMKAPYLQRKIVDLPTSVAQYSTTGVSAASALLGFLSVPSGQLWIGGLGALLGSRIGGHAGTRLVTHRQKALLPAVAALLAENMVELSEDMLYEISVKCGVSVEEVQLELGELYFTYFAACVRSPKVETVEISQLKKLKQFLNMSSAEVGAQVYKVAQQITSKREYTKFAFLAECVLRDDDPSGYEYEATRCRQELAITSEEWIELAEQSSLPIYQKAISAAVLEGKPCTTSQLEAVKTSLRIRDERAEELHKDLLERFAQSVLSSTGGFTDEDKVRVQTAQDLLGSETSLNLQATTLPSYIATFNHVLGEISDLDDMPDESFYRYEIEALDKAKQDLMLDSDLSETEDKAVRNFARAQLEACSELLLANDLPGLTEMLRLLSDTCLRISRFMALKNGMSEDDDAAISAFVSDINEGLLAKNEVDSFYRTMVQASVQDGEIEEGGAANLKRLCIILGVFVGDAEQIYQGTVGPLLRKVIDQTLSFLEEPGVVFDATQQKGVQDAIANLALDKIYVTSMTKAAYDTKLNDYASGDKTLTEEEATSLASLRDTFGLKEEVVTPMHEDLFGSTYANAVKEMLDEPGEIPSWAYEDLESLREVLGISKETGQELFGVIVKDRLAGSFKKGLDHLKYEEQVNSKVFTQDDIDSLEEPKNVTDSPNYDEDLRPFVVPILDMLDYATRCNSFVTKEVDGETVTTTGASIRDIKEDQARNIYRNFLESVYQCTNQTISDKLYTNLDKLALLLNLGPLDRKNINEAIGKTIYDQYMQPALAKGRLTVDDHEFLESINEDLSLSKHYSDLLYRQNEIKAVKSVTDAIFMKSEMRMDDVEKALFVADLHNVNLHTEVHLEKVSREAMYEVVIQYLIAARALQPGNLRAIGDYSEELHIPPQRGFELFSDYVEENIENHLVSAYSMMEHQFIEQALKDLKEVVKFASAHDVELSAGWTLPDRVKSQMFMLYAGEPPAEGVTEEEQREQQEVLKRVLGLQ